MTATLLKRCAECGSEFQPWVERCIDCGGPLEVTDGSAPPAAHDARDHDDVDEDELEEDYQDEADDEGADPGAAGDVCLRVVSVAWARSLSAALAADAIPHRIGAAPAEPGAARARPGMVAVYVRPEDREAAMAVDAAHERTEIPDLPDEPGSAEHCPACGEPCDPEAGECAGCGLEFPSAE
jgi:hypothetical protein